MSDAVPVAGLRLAEEQAAAKAAASHYAEAIRQAFGKRVRSIRLFGSLARGDWLGFEESDVDVVIVLEEVSKFDRDAVVSLATAELLRPPHAVISPLLLTRSAFDEMLGRELRLPREILEQGIDL